MPVTAQPCCFSIASTRASTRTVDLRARPATALLSNLLGLGDILNTILFLSDQILHFDFGGLELFPQLCNAFPLVINILVKGRQLIAGGLKVSRVAVSKLLSNLFKITTLFHKRVVTSHDSRQHRIKKTLLLIQKLLVTFHAFIDSKKTFL
ncbi:hypothetical protein HG530_004299 [Fusarium avenaceum]|nr:hypothetical protein HG530_004299 [Fusarium avenaceum]